MTLDRISEEDASRLLEGKPILSRGEIVKLLPSWIQDLSDAFLPQATDSLPPHRVWDHKIELHPGKESPYFMNRPLSVQELKVIRKWLDDNLSKRFIREFRARCAATLLLATKPGDGVRVCHDYRGLNNVTIKNRYPLPLIRETLEAIGEAEFYTKLDIISAFNKLRIAEGHEWKTAFIIRFGLYEFLVIPFGLCNAPASFQHYINHVLGDLLDKTYTAYLDDVLIYSATKNKHRDHIDINKCDFEATRTKYLGLIITSEGIEMDPKKVNAITSWEPPKSIKDLQGFLGFANFSRRFVQNFSMITQPINSLLKKESTWNWSNDQQRAFQNLKLAFTTASSLAFFNHERKTVLETDASDWASGGVLSLYGNDSVLRPVVYFSSKHTAAEANYEIYDKELLAIVKFLVEWRPELQGTQKPFEILTDYKKLEYVMTIKALNQRQVRWSEFLSQFYFRITYRPGAKAIRPDALSRKGEDRPNGWDINDDRIKNRERIILKKDKLDAKIIEGLDQL
ncbi:hypothetical protein K3495_g4304 [Podosphaera aphanis]|nr:hypothetical protein K3495_g4304 [Podosphaera aphanis]